MLFPPGAPSIETWSAGSIGGQAPSSTLLCSHFLLCFVRQGSQPVLGLKVPSMLQHSTATVLDSGSVAVQWSTVSAETPSHSAGYWPSGCSL